MWHGKRKVPRQRKSGKKEEMQRSKFKKTYKRWWLLDSVWQLPVCVWQLPATVWQLPTLKTSVWQLPTLCFYNNFQPKVSDNLRFPKSVLQEKYCKEDKATADLMDLFGRHFITRFLYYKDDPRKPGFQNSRVMSHLSVFDNFQFLSNNFQLLSDNFLPSKQVSDNFLPSKQVSNNSLPSKQVSDNFLPSSFTPTSNQKCLTTYGSPKMYLLQEKYCQEDKVTADLMDLFGRHFITRCLYYKDDPRKPGFRNSRVIKEDNTHLQRTRPDRTFRRASKFVQKRRLENLEAPKLPDCPARNWFSNISFLSFFISGGYMQDRNEWSNHEKKSTLSSLFIFQRNVTVAVSFVLLSNDLMTWKFEICQTHP